MQQFCSFPYLEKGVGKGAHAKRKQSVVRKKKKAGRGEGIYVASFPMMSSVVITLNGRQHLPTTPTNRGDVAERATVLPL